MQLDRRPRPNVGERWAAASLAAGKVAVGLWALHAGFTHVSDDDYSRVTIAEAFAHAPHVDPSRTSWLPFPFWLNGLAMLVFGRTLAVARIVAIASGVVGAVLFQASLRRVGLPRWSAWVAAALAMGAPWSVWLGVATVPEALTAALIATAAVCLSEPRARVCGAAALLVASLSRYEAWPVCLVYAGVSGFGVIQSGERRTTRGTQAVAAGLALLGPLAWLLWNLHAHDDPLHFVARVTAYRSRIAGSAGGDGFFYPNALLDAGGAAVLLGLVGTPAFVLDREFRRRWCLPSIAILAMFAFLVEGERHDSAPTHHPERALIAVFWIATAFGVDGVRTLAVRYAFGRPQREAVLASLVTAAGVARLLTWPTNIANFPAASAGEDRTTQIAVGDDLRARRVEHVTLVPCAYEHFATIAAYGAPESVTVEARPSDVQGPCPIVFER